MRDLIILGAGGSGWDIVSIVKAINMKNPEWNILGYLDDNEVLLNKEFSGVRVIGTIKDCIKFPNAYFISSIANPTNRLVRRNIWDKVKLHNLRFATLIHPSAIIYDDVTIKEGCVVNANCMLGNGAILDEDVHLAYACNIAHETHLKEHTTLGTGVNLSSGVVICEDCYIGAGVSSTHDITVEPNTLVAVGSAITEDLANNSMKMWIGVPAISIKDFVKNKK